jgi:asparagine synthase (glutamine-hydrolysing)
MCGISISISPSNKINIAEFEKQNSIINHRGPDDEGYVFFDKNNNFMAVGGNDTPQEVYESTLLYSPKGKINEMSGDYSLALGHRRLSIIDVSPYGHMPMSNSESKLWITFNGEIYNYLEIREELMELGHIFNTQTDTEVILAAYKEWGIECQNKFNGMWAFAIFNTDTNKLFVSRDRFGIKPLYYWLSPSGNLFLASEIKQFTVLNEWKSQLNHQRAYDYLFYSLTDHTDETLFQNVYSFSPGHFAEININATQSINERISILKWYNPILTNFTGTYKEACTKFNSLFKRAASLNLRADVKVGSALSGGLDSSAIVCEINKVLVDQHKSSLQETFSSCSVIARFDEKKWIDVVLNQTNAVSHIIYPDPNNIFTQTETIIWHMDEPYQSQSVFLGNNIFKESKDNNVKVLLNGQGADEYLSGYEEFNLYRKFDLLKKAKLKKLLRELKLSGSSAFISFFKYTSFRILPDFINNILSIRNQKYKQINKLINGANLKFIRTNPVASLQSKSNSTKIIVNKQIYINPLQKYLRWEDRNSMQFGVEARVPFLDHNLVEFAMQMPIDYLDSPKYSKKLLRDSLMDILPVEITLRKDKMGFTTPEENWFKEAHYEEFEKMLLENFDFCKGIFNKKEVLDYFKNVQNGTVGFDYTYWRIISLCIWMKVFDVKI